MEVFDLEFFPTEGIEHLERNKDPQEMSSSHYSVGLQIFANCVHLNSKFLICFAHLILEVFGLLYMPMLKIFDSLRLLQLKNRVDT